MSAKLLGRTGATAGQDYPLKDLVRLGASPENEIRIAAPGVSRRHARIWKENDQFFVEDVGATNGTFLNGGRIQKETLRHLDVITLGREVDLIFINRGGTGDTAGTTPVDLVRTATLKLMDGPEAGTVIDVPKGELSFGRSETCNVVLASRAIGKLHARIQRTGNQVVLQDLQSVNGTFVNGSRVDVTVLANGDTINFAGVRNLMVTIEGAEGVAAARQGSPVAMSMPAFDQEWKTRFMWSPDELAAIEAARKDAQALAELRSAPADQKPAAPKPAAAAKPVIAEKPVPAAAVDKMPPKAVVAKPEPAAAKPAEPPKPAAAPSAAAPPKPPVPSPHAAAPPQPAAPKPAPPPASPKPAQPAEAAPTPAAAARPAAPAKPPADDTAAVAPDALAAASKERAAAPPKIRAVRLVSADTTVQLGLGSFTIGRSATADVRLDDRQVSRQHATITVTETTITIDDLQTVNGTLVNGREVKGRETLRSGDTVLLGSSEFKVEVIAP